MNEGLILLTGASTGIGRSTARQLAREGYTVLAGVRSERDAQSLRDEQVAGLEPIILDVTKPEQMEQAYQTIRSRVGEQGLRALVNNAGINYVAPFELSDEVKVRHLMEVNVFGLLNLTRRMLPLLQAYARQSGDTAKVVNLGSIGSAIGIPWEHSYHAAKFAVLGLSQSLRFELEPLGIQVSCVMPGGIKTEFMNKSTENSTTALSALTGPNRDYYTRNLTAYGKVAAQVERLGSKPEKVAGVIAKVIRTRRPRLKYLVGADAKLINSLVWFGIPGVLKSQFVK
jgi:NAD(P)-dependent dehydrogenase (short-subunit alcohol dehydrogenase family)